jgi:hypothetical protein
MSNVSARSPVVMAVPAFAGSSSSSSRGGGIDGSSSPFSTVGKFSDIVKRGTLYVKNPPSLISRLSLQVSAQFQQHSDCCLPASFGLHVHRTGPSICSLPLYSSVRSAVYSQNMAPASLVRCVRSKPQMTT